MKEIKAFNGNNSDLTRQYNSFYRNDISAKSLKQMMNKYRYQLEENDVMFLSKRSNGQRFVKVWYSENSVSSDVSDLNSSGNNPSVICDPCVPESDGQ